MRGPSPTGFPLLSPRGPADARQDNPWIVWQPLDRPEAFTCSRCGEEKSGLRYVELTGTEPRIWPVLPKNPAHLETVASRVGRRVYCEKCRRAQPAAKDPPKRKKHGLD